jgi:hypothetical protein
MVNERVIANENGYGIWEYGRIHNVSSDHKNSHKTNDGTIPTHYDIIFNKNSDTHQITFAVPRQMIRKVVYDVGDEVFVEDILPQIYDLSKKSPPEKRKATVTRRWENNVSYDILFDNQEVRLGTHVKYIYSLRPFQITDSSIVYVDPPKTTPKQHQEFLHGERIRGNIKDTGVWKYGYIVSGDVRLYHVNFDVYKCSTNLNDLSPEMIQPVFMNIGDKVKVNYRGQRKLRTAVITDKWENDLYYNVVYDDNGEQGYGVNCKLIRPFDENENDVSDFV